AAPAQTPGAASVELHSPASTKSELVFAQVLSLHCHDGNRVTVGVGEFEARELLGDFLAKLQMNGLRGGDGGTGGGIRADELGMSLRLRRPERGGDAERYETS